MKYCIVLCLFAIVAVALGRPDEKYTDKYDNLNIDELLNNPRLFDSYSKCILDEGKCPPEGNELKSNIGDALENRCAKCTDKQKTETHRVLGHVINKHPDIWNKLIAKYDPDNKYSTMYENELKKVTSNQA